MATEGRSCLFDQEETHTKCGCVHITAAAHGTVAQMIVVVELFKSNNNYCWRWKAWQPESPLINIVIPSVKLTSALHRPRQCQFGLGKTICAETDSLVVVGFLR